MTAQPALFGRAVAEARLHLLENDRPGRLFRLHRVLLERVDVEILGNVGDDGTYFDTSAFARVTDVGFGNVGRNTMRGPGVVNLDASLFRVFKLTSPFQLQFRAEAFNVTNTPHFANPNGNVNSSNFERITATQTAYALGRSREVRFGLRLRF